MTTQQPGQPWQDGLKSLDRTFLTVQTTEDSLDKARGHSWALSLISVMNDIGLSFYLTDIRLKRVEADIMSHIRLQLYRYAFFWQLKPLNVRVYAGLHVYVGPNVHLYSHATWAWVWTQTCFFYKEIHLYQISQWPDIGLVRYWNRRKCRYDVYFPTGKRASGRQDFQQHRTKK
jgi:hypothetical protein